MDRLRREALLLLAIGGLGILLMPALVYRVGQQLLGEYLPGATMGTFYGDLYGHLAEPSAWAWLLVLGPWLAIQLLRLLWLPLRPLMREPAEPGDEAPPPRQERIEPTI